MLEANSGRDSHYNKQRSPLPIQKLEFMTDADGNPRYIIATPLAGYNVKFHQRSRPVLA